MSVVVPARTYLNTSLRAWGVLGALLGLVLIVVAVAQPALDLWSTAAIAVIGAATIAASWVFYLNPRLVLGAETIDVVNPLRRYSIPLHQVEGVAGSQSLELQLSGGRVVRVWSVQAANVSLMLRRKSHVDRVAAEIAGWIEAHRSDREPGSREVIVEQRPRGALIASWFVPLGVAVSLVIRWLFGMAG